MAATRIICPKCGEPVRNAPPPLPAQQARCPACRAVLAPAPARGLGGHRPLILALVLGGLAGVLLLGGGLAAYLIFGRGGGGATGTVTRADLDKVEAYMSLAEVEGVLGKGRQVRYEEIGFMPAGRDDPSRIWYEWPNGDDSLVVGFEPGLSGTRRVVVSFYLQRSTTAGTFQQIPTLGVVTARFPGSDLDQLAQDAKDQKKALSSPRWLKGPAVRKALLGSWVAFGLGSYHFNSDGTCSGGSVGTKRFTGSYRFVDDQSIEMTLMDAPLFPGQNVRAQTLTCKVLVDGDELVLIDSRFPKHPTTYKRTK